MSWSHLREDGTHGGTVRNGTYYATMRPEMLREQMRNAASYLRASVHFCSAYLMARQELARREYQR